MLRLPANTREASAAALLAPPTVCPRFPDRPGRQRIVLTVTRGGEAFCRGAHGDGRVMRLQASGNRSRM